MKTRPPTSFVVLPCLPFCTCCSLKNDSNHVAIAQINRAQTGDIRLNGILHPAAHTQTHTDTHCLLSVRLNHQIWKVLSSSPHWSASPTFSWRHLSARIFIWGEPPDPVLSPLWIYDEDSAGIWDETENKWWHDASWYKLRNCWRALTTCLSARRTKYFDGFNRTLWGRRGYLGTGWENGHFWHGAEACG